MGVNNIPNVGQGYIWYVYLINTNKLNKLKYLETCKSQT